MKIIKNSLKILILFLVVFACRLRALAIESPASADSSVPLAAQTDLLQLGSQIHSTSFDCSHLVHALYERVGLHYPYATSRTLYGGIEEFKRVPEPISGDVVVWRGHMGIVVDPAQHSFLSALKARVKTSSYISGYWKHRGTPRFFRFAASAGKSDQ
jgi:cell wall-associated NlpC family hydrolase